MSVYVNEKKIYPDLNPTAPQETQKYRLNKLSEIETYLLNEIEVCKQLLLLLLLLLLYGLLSHKYIESN